MKDKNPSAFKPRVKEDDTEEKTKHLVGCNCTRSNCLKKYCECFKAGIKCNPDHCRCRDCKNQEFNSDIEIGDEDNLSSNNNTHTTLNRTNQKVGIKTKSKSYFL